MDKEEKKTAERDAFVAMFEGLGPEEQDRFVVDAVNNFSDQKQAELLNIMSREDLVVTLKRILGLLPEPERRKMLAEHPELQAYL